ncbi:ABC transporter permease, partial [Parvibaculum sp.]|uniref:ABC transporter permease n=1 Tax=Parvibaculum sp. TaxID=2024848 RepID=UPI0032EBD952
MTDVAHPGAKSTGRSRAFGAFEWLLAMRYLRSRRREVIVSVIAGISIAGIMLGVATLIIVMSVMNGFRTELLSRILGVNGHMFVQGVGTNIMDYDTIAARIAEVPGVVSVAPLVDGQVMVQSARSAGGALVRGMREADLKNLSVVADSVTAGSLDGLDEGGVARGSRLAQRLG